MKDEVILEAMELFGGCFAQALARAARVADRESLTRIKRAFPDMWADYAALAAQVVMDRKQASA